MHVDIILSKIYPIHDGRACIKTLRPRLVFANPPQQVMAVDSHHSLLSFQNAIDNFKTRSGLTNKELADMQMTSLSDLQKALAEIQRKQQHSKTMKFLRRLQPFLDAMEEYSKAINIFANASDIIAFIWVRLIFVH